MFTDGSRINKKIGSAAVLPQLGRAEAYIGKDSLYRVYSAELYGIFLALLIIVLKRTASLEVYIFADNQAAITAVQKPGRTSGQIIIRDIVKLIDHVRAEGYEPVIYWIPVYRGLTGNEAADKAIKHATGWRQRKYRARIIKEDTDYTAKPSIYPRRLTAAIKTEIKKDAQNK